MQNVTGQPNKKNAVSNPISSGCTYTPEFRTNLVGAVWSALSTVRGPSTNTSEVSVTN